VTRSGLGKPGSDNAKKRADGPFGLCRVGLQEPVNLCLRVSLRGLVGPQALSCLGLRVEPIWRRATLGHPHVTRSRFGRCGQSLLGVRRTRVVMLHLTVAWRNFPRALQPERRDAPRMTRIEAPDRHPSGN
jgi:hypothetical protein